MVCLVVTVFISHMNVTGKCFLLIQASLTKDNDVQSKKAAELDGKVKNLDLENKNLPKALDKQKTANTTAQVRLFSLQVSIRAKILMQKLYNGSILFIVC